MEEYQHIWKKVLSQGEEVKHEFSIAKTYRYLGIVVSFLIGVLVGLKVIWLGALIFLFGLFHFGWFLKKANAFAFTSKRVVVHRGLFGTETTTVDYDKITDVKVREPFLEKVFLKSGSLIINTAGTPKPEIVLKHVPEPYELKKKLCYLK